MEKEAFVSVVIPVYNNFGSLKKSYVQLESVLSEFPNKEVIFVNDGSKDDSLQELLDLKQEAENVKIIDFSRNFGQIPATTAGIRSAKGDVVIVISADLQDPISLMPELISNIKNGFDIVIAYRKDRNEGVIKKITSRIYFKMLKYHTKAEVPDGGFDYFLLTRTAANALNRIDNKIRGLHYDILSLGFNIKYIPYGRVKRTIGKSQYNFLKRFNDFSNAFISISFLPIRAIILTGIIFATLGFVYAGSIIRAWFIGNTPFQGWAPIMVLLLVIGGILMIMIGLVGEYIWRIYEEIKDRPKYIIKKQYD